MRYINSIQFWLIIVKNYWFRESATISTGRSVFFGSVGDFCFCLVSLTAIECIDSLLRDIVVLADRSQWWLMFLYAGGLYGIVGLFRVHSAITGMYQSILLYDFAQNYESDSSHALCMNEWICWLRILQWWLLMLTHYFCFQMRQCFICRWFF